MVRARHAVGRPPRWPVLSLLLILAVGIAACDAGAAATRAPATPGATTAPASSAAVSSSSLAPAASTDTASAPPVGPSDQPSADPGASPSGSAAPGAAAACTGTDKNRTFFATVAAAVAWDVYCPVLPAGWSVVSGTYQLTAGGKLDISYRGPGGALLRVREGAFCTDSNGCITNAPDRGAVPFADRQAELYTAPNATSSAVVDAGARISWVVETQNVDETAVREFLAHLSKVQ